MAKSKKGGEFIDCKVIYCNILLLINYSECSNSSMHIIIQKLTFTKISTLNKTFILYSYGGVYIGFYLKQHCLVVF